MDEPNIDESASISELKARLFEKDRVEKYLRSEVEELWTHINDLNKLPFLALHLKIVSLLRFFLRKVKQVLLPTKKSKTQNQVHKPITKVLSADILLVLPTDKIEIGGLVSAAKLVKQLGNFGFSIKILSLNHDPTGQMETDRDFISSIPESFKTSLVISSGAETIKFVQDYAKKYGTKSLLLMQGPDPYFTPNFNNASEYLTSLSSFDSVITLSPFLTKLAKFWGAKKIVNATLGPDQSIFKLDVGVKKLKQIVVPCRFGVEKGIRFLIPTLKELRNAGWKIVGFGDLPDLSMAKFFDDFLGRISPEETSILFQESMILIDPSLVEGLGLSALEASRCGCIPIVQKRGGFDGMFEFGKEPFIEITNFLDPETILEAVHKSQTELNPKQVSDWVSHINWDNGFLIAKKEISELISNNSGWRQGDSNP